MTTGTRPPPPRTEEPTADEVSAESAALRIRMEGGLERIEQVLGRWNTAAEALRRADWHRADSWQRLDLSEEEREAIERLQSLSRRNVDARAVHGRLKRGRESLGALAARRLAQLGVRQVPPDAGERLRLLAAERPELFFTLAAGALGPVALMLSVGGFFSLLIVGTWLLRVESFVTPAIGLLVAGIAGATFLNREASTVAIGPGYVLHNDVRLAFDQIRDVRRRRETGADFVEVETRDGRLLRWLLPASQLEPFLKALFAKLDGRAATPPASLG